MEYIDRFGLLGPQMTLGHGVWLNEADIDRLAATGTCVCHNCSSNFRLRSGVAALNVFEAKGINTAIGLDEAGINDDRDMLQEMRMVLRAHRVPGMEDDVPTPAQVFRMATSGGAKTTAFGERLGVLEPGRAADMVLIDWRQVSYPYLDAETPLLDAVLQRAKTQGVHQRDLRRRGDLCRRQLHQGGSRRRVARAARRSEQGAGGRRGGAAQAVEGAAAACEGVLRQLFRPGRTCAILPAEFPHLTGGSAWPTMTW